MSKFKNPTFWGVSALVLLAVFAVTAAGIYVNPPGRNAVEFYTDDVASIRVGDDVRIAELRTAHRFGASIGQLAQAIRAGDADGVLDLLAAGGPHVEFVDTAQPTAALRDLLVANAMRIRAAAAAGDPAAALAHLDRHRLLCAHRDGPSGVRHWNQQVERWLAEETGESFWAQWYLGRPVLVTANDYGLGLYNGDTGVCFLVDGSLRVAVAGADRVQEFAASRLSEVETMHAMTIHKSQGSQATEVTVLLPPEDSRLLTRELLYTAVTRAREKVRVAHALAGLPKIAQAMTEGRLSYSKVRELSRVACSATEDYLLTIALLGAIESLLSARVADAAIEDRHDPNQELIAQGIANLVATYRSHTIF